VAEGVTVATGVAGAGVGAAQDASARLAKTHKIKKELQAVFAVTGEACIAVKSPMEIIAGWLISWDGAKGIRPNKRTLRALHLPGALHVLLILESRQEL